MRFKHLHLQSARLFCTSKSKTAPQQPGRRKFVKAIGLGSLAWNPLINSMQNLQSSQYFIRKNREGILVYKNNHPVWQVSTAVFEKDICPELKETESSFLLNIKQLKYLGTDFVFSLQLELSKEGEHARLIIPELGIHSGFNFVDWLEDLAIIEGRSEINQSFVQLDNSDRIELGGQFDCRLTSDWQLVLKSSKKIHFYFRGTEFVSSEVRIGPDSNRQHAFLKTAVANKTLVVLPEIPNSQQILTKFNLNTGSLTANEDEHLDICISTGKNSEKVLWANTYQTGAAYKLDKIAKTDVPLAQFFFFAEYLNNQKIQNYFSARLPENGYWLNNDLGAFKIERDQKMPDLEAFGTDFNFPEVILEPRLRAFQPRISNAITGNTVFPEPKNIRLTGLPDLTENWLDDSSLNNQQQDPAKPVRQNQAILNSSGQQDPQRTVRKVQPNLQKIEVEFDRLKFKPKNALTIRVLRPEDLLLLEFEFHNFNFTNRGKAPYLELDNRKNPGVMVVYFQSQHTLEEAYYETSSIHDPDPSGSTTVRLPARHLRARKSRLVYELAANHPGFPLILEELLDWSKFSLRVHPRAWIKMPSVRVKSRAQLQLNTQNTIQVNQNLKYLSSSSPDYGIRLAQNTRFKAENLQVYNDLEVQKVLLPEAAASVQPSFDTNILKKISWKVEPIPDLSTSIEAPTLMYVSPNQVNDFYHKVDVDFRDVEDLSFGGSRLLNTEMRVLDPLSTNKGEISELWHTRLGVKLRNGKTSGSALPHLRTIRALWADDAVENYKTPKPRNHPFMASLDANNRQKLVHITSNYTAGFTPFPVPVNDLMLTTLGAYIDWHGYFDVPNPQDTELNIIEWEHIATLGRDHYVKVVEEGYLFPFGHRAAVVKITERKFDQQTMAAVNRQRMYIVVLQKEVLYSRNDPNGQFIEFPFQSVTIKTSKTPNIDDPQNSTLVNVSSTGGFRIIGRNSSGANTTYNFYIKVAQAPFYFNMVATDKEGIEQAFRIPLAFMENRIARNASLVQQVIDVYRGDQSNNFNKLYNESDFNGQKVAYAEFLVDGDTAFETEFIKFDAQVLPGLGEGELKFHPRIKEADIFVEQISELTGIRETVKIGLEDDQNDGEVFARVLSNNRIDFSGGSDKSGGFLVPNMGVSGLSKLQGPVNGKLTDMKSMKFVPEEFFEAMNDLPVAKIFGVIDIFSLLLGSSSSPLDLGGSLNGMKNAVKSIRKEIDEIKNEILFLEEQAENGQQSVQDQINSLKQQVKSKVDQLLQTLNDSVPRIPNLKVFVTEEAFYAEYKWQPQLGGQKIEVIPSLLNVNVTNPSNALSVTTKFEKPFSADKPASMNGVARFEKFGIDIVPLLAVNFNYLEFRTGSSEKTGVKVDIDANKPIEFKGVLNFVNNLQNVIPSNGFSDSGPYMKLSPTGVTAGFDIAIPNVEVGICMISNISLGANVTLPFTGAPLTMGFNFCKRENPFMLTISCFGGGGYFMMVTTLEGIQSIEAAFEFGAAMSLNVGVASGGVSAMGGFYYKMELVDGEKTTTLSGYLRLNGHLSILGLISLSLEFYLAFVAVIVAGKVQKLEGVATLKVKVEVLFFSKTVSVTVRRELKGADADPKFIEMIDPDDWQEYCLAFAG